LQRLCPSRAVQGSDSRRAGEGQVQAMLNAGRIVVPFASAHPARDAWLSGCQSRAWCV